MATIFWLCIYGVHIGEYDWTVCVRWRCSLMSNYFDHLFVFIVFLLIGEGMLLLC